MIKKPFIAIINGPNLQMQGLRQPDIYGTWTMPGLHEEMIKRYPEFEIQMHQSNCEGCIIDLIYQVGLDERCVGIVINPGAYAHYSYAIADALKAVPVGAIEVHISDISKREAFRRKSVTHESCKTMISGQGKKGYFSAVENLIEDYKANRQ